MQRVLRSGRRTGCPQLIEWVGTHRTGDFAGIRTGPGIAANCRVVPALTRAGGDHAGGRRADYGRELRRGHAPAAAGAARGAGVRLFAARRLRDADEIPHLDG
jgi:hypothetical protein